MGNKISDHFHYRKFKLEKKKRHQEKKGEIEEIDKKILDFSYDNLFTITKDSNTYSFQSVLDYSLEKITPKLKKIFKFAQKNNFIIVSHQILLKNNNLYHISFVLRHNVLTIMQI